MKDRMTAIALFDDRARAKQAIEQLKLAGFTEKEIGVTARDSRGKDTDVAGDRKETHAKEGAIAGVSAGAGVGALWGLGILAGVLPAIGPAIAGGTLAAILSSAAAGAATAGLAGTLIGLGIPEDEANYYDREFQAGRVLVTVSAGSRIPEAQSILVENGGYDMGSARGATGTADVLSETATAGEEMTDEDEVDAALARENLERNKRDRDIRPRTR